MPSKQEIVAKALMAGLEVKMGVAIYKVFKKDEQILTDKGIIKAADPLLVCHTFDKEEVKDKVYAVSNLTVLNLFVRCELLITEEYIAELMAKMTREV